MKRDYTTAAQMRRDGASDSEIARLYGVTRQAIYHALRGVERGKKVTWHDEAAALVSAGHAPAAVAARYAVTETWVKTLCKRRGVAWPVRTPADHGSRTMYGHHGCRCAACRAAQAAYMQKRYAMARAKP